MVSHMSVDLVSSGMATTGLIDHLDDEEIMDTAIPIVSAAFPIETPANEQCVLRQRPGDLRTSQWKV